MQKKLFATAIIGIFSSIAVISLFRNQTPKSLFTPAEKQIPRHEASRDGAPSRDEDKNVMVTRVIDGDTIEIESGAHVRYIGMNTPETVDPRKPIQCFGAEASAKNKEFVEKKYVRLEKDVSETDRYGRLLRYVFVGDTMINLLLVKEGYATAATFPPDVKYYQRFLDAEREAREQQRGLWNACPIKIKR